MGAWTAVFIFCTYSSPLFNSANPVFIVDLRCEPSQGAGGLHFVNPIFSRESRLLHCTRPPPLPLHNTYSTIESPGLSYPSSNDVDTRNSKRRDAAAQTAVV